MKSMPPITRCTRITSSIGRSSPGIEPAVDSDAGVIKSKLDTLFETSCVKIVFAESEEAAEAEYQDYIKKAEELGLADYEAALNEAYQANLQKMGK